MPQTPELLPDDFRPPGRRPKQGEYFMHAVAIAGRTKQLLLFSRALKYSSNYCVALITEKFVNGHNYKTVNNLNSINSPLQRRHISGYKNYGRHEAGLTGLSFT